MSTSTTDINVSLEPHLAHSLREIFPLLPTTNAQDLGQYLEDPLPSIIPYRVLHAISQWARSEQAQDLLKSKNLDHHDYSMIALLAGTMTSPERKFGPYVPPKEPEEIEAYKIQERKSITALFNALLSIGGVAFATWWAADKTGWSNEWRVLFALFAAILVAVSEAGLYMIWQSRRSHSKKPKTRIQYDKKIEQPSNNSSSIELQSTSTSMEESTTLRQRR